VINVMALYADRGGCGEYRVKFPAAAVNARAQDLGVHVTTADHLAADATFTDNKYHIRRVDVPAGVKVVSFQRPLQAGVYGAIAWLKARRPDIGIAIELDDDLDVLPTSNSAYRSIQNNPLENTMWLHKSIALADVLTVSTTELAKQYGRKTRTFIINNGVPTSMLTQPLSRPLSRRRELEMIGDRTIGWAGHVGTHPGDLEMTCGALRDFIQTVDMNERHVNFRNIGPREDIAKSLGLEETNIEASGWLSSDMYRIALGELDIGIVPLCDTRFNRSKSALKALEMAAAGVPVIASATPEHDALKRAGMPLWVVRNRRVEWAAALKHLVAMTDGELKELAASHREYVRRYGTVEHRAGDWASAWSAAARIATERSRTDRQSAVRAS